MNALMSARPRRGSCSEYFSSISGAAISSMTPRLTVLPQNSVNQRPTTALLSSCLLIEGHLCFAGTTDRLAIAAITRHRGPEQNSGSCLEIEITSQLAGRETRAVQAKNARTIASAAPE